jgi:hypothetical protein
VIASTPPGATISIDGEVVGQSPVTVPAKPGRHDLVVTITGYETEQRPVFAIAEQTTAIQIVLKRSAETTAPVAPAATSPAPQPSAAPAAPPDTSSAHVFRPSRGYAYLTGGIALAAIAVGSIYGVRALSASDDYKSHPTVDGLTTGEGYATISTASFVTAAVFAAATAAIWIGSSGSESAARAPFVRF